MRRRTTAPAEQEPDKPKAKRGMDAANTMQFVKSKLDKLLHSNHHRQQVIWDEDLRARHQARLCVLVSRGPKHAKRATISFRALFYLPSQPGKPHYFPIGRYPHGEFTYPWKGDDGKPITIQCSDIDAVRRAAIDIYNRARSGKDPRRPESSDVFEDVVKEYLDDHTSQRTFVSTQKTFHTYIVPEWRYWKITDIKRSDVTILLDKIKRGRIKSQNGNGNIGTPIVARAVFAQLRNLFNWHARRSDHFNSPLVIGMTKDITKSKARARVLDELELRIMWPLLDNISPIFGALFKLALLTGQRVGKISEMRRSDVKPRMFIPTYRKPDGEWVPAQEIDQPVWDPTSNDDPENKLASQVPLSKMAQQVIASLPIFDSDSGSDYVFSCDGRRPVGNSRHYPKQQLDEEMRKALPDMKPWVIHDLRRTARTLMEQAGISSQVAERCLGHKIRGIEGVYNRYKYAQEKRFAFDELAALIERIVHPPKEDNVVALKRR